MPLRNIGRDIKEDDDMGLGIGTISTNRSGKTTITLKNPDGSTAGTISFTKANRYKSTKKKRLGYNFKKISNRIMTSKTSNNAGKVVREARGSLVALLMKQQSGDYDEQELKHAITHARAMERIAKKRRKHMEEEERAKNAGASLVEEEAEIAEEEGEEEERQQEEVELSSEELERLSQELEQLMEESMQAMRELADQLMSASWEKMDADDIENMKKRHRADELRDILEADMKYLKALFDRLSKEKQANASGANSFRSDSAESSNGVSLELSGVEMPVEVSEAPVMVEGANVDVSI